MFLILQMTWHKNILVKTLLLIRVEQEVQPIEIGRSKCSNNSFVYSAIKDWNNLPANIKECTSKSSFKTHVKDHLRAEARARATDVFIYT